MVLLAERLQSREPSIELVMGNAEREMTLHSCSLLLLFTRGMSIELWDSVGMLERELALYERLRPELLGIRFLSYGGDSEYRYQDRLGDIKILVNKNDTSPTRFSILAPVLYRKDFRNSQVVKTNQIDGAWTGVIAKLLFRSKLIVRCGYLRSEFQRKLLGDGAATRLSRLLERMCFKFADVCIVASERDKQYVANVHGVPERKIRVVPNYVKTDVFRRLPDIKKEPGLLCFVGRLTPQKNLEALFDAVKGIPNVKLLIIGNGHLRDCLQKKAEDNGLDVEFHSRVLNHELPRYLNRAQVYVQPSLFEGCPKTLLEAMACEVPVIGTDVEGIRDIIRHGDNGILCDKSPDSIRRAILSVLEDEESARKLGKNARQYIIENHSLDHIVQMELGIIEKVYGK